MGLHNTDDRLPTHARKSSTAYAAGVTAPSLSYEITRLKKCMVGNSVLFLVNKSHVQNQPNNESD